MSFCRDKTTQTLMSDFSKGVDYAVDVANHFINTGSTVIVPYCTLYKYTNNSFYQDTNDWHSHGHGYYSRNESDAFNKERQQWNSGQQRYEASFTQKITTTFGPIRAHIQQLQQENDRLKHENEQLINQLKQRNTTSTNHSEAK